MSHYDITKFAPEESGWGASVETPSTGRPGIEIDINADIYFEDGIGGPIVARVPVKRLLEILVEKGVAQRVENGEVCK